MQQNLGNNTSNDETAGAAPAHPDAAVETLHGGDKPDAELVLPAHDHENVPEEQRRKP